MNIQNLQEALDRYGGDLRRWPEAMRSEAEAFAANDANAARLLAMAARLDNVLAEAMRPMPVDAAMIGRIVSHLGDASPHDFSVQPTRRLAAWAGAAMVALLVTGYAVGLALPASEGEDAFAGLIFGDSGTAAVTDSDSGSVL